jgi:UDP-2-acetamido-2,6-beta-L-arabino-hexul-4-ose reductase
LYPKHFPVPLDLKTDNRGSFVEIIKERGGGQTSFSTTHPGVVRGNHYHIRKIERFCVVSGEAVIKLRKLFTKEIIEYKVSGDKPVYVDMPTYHTHSIENTGNGELITMFWISEIFDPADPDTFSESVEV